MIHNINTKGLHPKIKTALRILSDTICAPLNMNATKPDFVAVGTIYGASGDIDYKRAETMIHAAIERAGEKWPNNVYYELPALRLRDDNEKAVISEPKKKTRKKKVKPEIKIDDKDNEGTAEML